MKNPTPLGLKILRILSIAILFFSSFALLNLKEMFNYPVVLLLYVAALAFYVILIVAINKQNKALFRIILVLAVIFILISASQFLILKSSHILVRILIEIVLFGYLWKTKNYFSK